MIPAGYMAKRVYKRPDWLKAPHVAEIYSVSGCISEDFADYINYWKHNGYWFFDSPELIKAVAKENSIQLQGTSLFYYEAYEMEFDGECWTSWLQEPSFKQTLPCLQKNNLRVSMSLLFTLEAPQSTLRSRAILWQKKFIRTHIAYLSPLVKARKVLITGLLRTLSRAHSEYFRCIP